MPQNVSVNGEIIADQQIRAGVTALREDLENRNGPLTLEQRLELRNYVINDLIGRLLVVQEARRLNLDPPTEEKLVEHWGQAVKQPTPGEIREYYRKNRERFQRREMLHAAHIVKNSAPDQPPTPETRQLMETLHQRLLAGESFAALATEYSDFPENGGDLGFIPKGVMADEFDAAIADLPVNTPTPVFETPFGLHIAIVYERRPPGIASLEEVSPNISAGLLRVLQQNEVRGHLAELRRNAVIRTDPA